MARSDWYKLDNVGKFYAAQAGRGNQTVFRFSATMSEEVDHDSLQAALARAVRRHPGFNVMLRSGLFWHYLEPASEVPAVLPESLPICTGLHEGLDSVLFRVSYHRERINLEVSHMISDGRGTLEFLRALLRAYVEERYAVACEVPQGDPPTSRRTEDSYTANYEREKAGKGVSQRIFRLKGWKNATEPTYMEYHLSADGVHAVAKSMGVSITSLMIAAVIVSIRSVMPPSERERAICLNIPVDLRDLFGSDTLRNFFGLAFVSYVPGYRGDSLEDIAREMQVQLREAVKPDAIKRRMNRMIKLEKNPALRLAPLFLKDIVLKLAERIAAKDVTSTVSSIGRIKLDEVTDPYVRDINVLTSTRGLNFVVCTFKDVMSVGISSVFVNNDVIRCFCRLFSDLGIEGTISLNKEAAQVDLELKQAWIESSFRRLGPERREDERS